MKSPRQRFPHPHLNRMLLTNRYDNFFLMMCDVGHKGTAPYFSYTFYRVAVLIPSVPPFLRFSFVNTSMFPLRLCNNFFLFSKSTTQADPHSATRFFFPPTSRRSERH